MRESAVFSFSTCLFFSVLLAPCAGQTPLPDQHLTASRDAINRWQNMRFGLFIHWGPVSLTGREIGWSRAGERRGHRSKRGTQTPVDMYDNLYKKFDPVNFDADEWVRIAKSAGMKYLVFTTKHHDGFCNFDSKLTDYKITSPDSPYGKDIVRQIADACHRADLGLGWYYSPPDWHHPDYRNGKRHAAYIKYLHGQIRELMTGYGHVDIMWFDGLGGRADDWDSPTLLKTIRQLQPGIVINNRAGLPADYDTPEQRVGSFNRDRPWETCMTICRQWAWKPDDRMKSRVECLQMLLRVVGGDGNLLFNVGPMPDGRIEPRQVKRLKEMGDWLKEYGAGVYATRGGPFKPGRWGASTCRDDRVYVFVMNWPDDGALTLPAIDQQIVSAQTLTQGTAAVKQTEDGIQVTLSEADRDAVATVIELRVSGRAETIKPVNPNRSGSIAFDRSSTASNVYHSDPRYAAGKALDDDPETRWATDSGTQSAWIDVDLGQPQTFNRVRIDECVRFGQRVRKFELQYKAGQEWQTCLSGTTIGKKFSKQLAPVTSQNVRLNIIDASDGPTIWEFQLFPSRNEPR